MSFLMRHKNQRLLLFIAALLLFLSPIVFGQNDQAIFQWKSYLPYTMGRYVTQSATSIYYASDYSVLEIDKEDDSVRRLSKIDGLSDVEARIVKHSTFGEILIVVYANGNIDLVTPDRFINLPFLKNVDILGDRNVYDVSIVSANRAFLSTGFGILEINPVNATFTNDIRTGFPVYSVAAFQNYLFAASGEGIYRASNASSVNLQDFSSNWVLLDEEYGFPADYSTRTFAEYRDYLYLNLNDELYRYDGSSLVRVYSEGGYQVKFLSAEGAHLLIGLECKGGCPDKVVAMDAAGNFTPLAATCSQDAQVAIEDESGRIWFADNSRGFRMLPSIQGTSCQSTIYDGPPTANLWDLEVIDRQLWIATGGYTDALGYLFRRDGILSLIDNQWKQYNWENYDAMKGVDPIDRNDDLFDMVTIAANPFDGKIYAGSYIEGLVEFDPVSNEMILYNEQNSSLSEVAENDPGRVRITGLAVDHDGNLWVNNYLAERPFSVLTKEKTWKSFSTQSCGRATSLLDIVVDDSNNKWISVDDPTIGLMIFHEGQDLEDAADDQCRLITASNSALPSNEVNCLAVDLDGDVWVGTENGAVVFQCGSDVFNTENCRGFAPRVDVDGDLALLLENENVRAIAVDGANRKWFGTTNGIFVQSPAGDGRVFNYNASNSPLFDNQILDLAIDQQTGEVFVGTAKGLQSIRTNATAGGVLHSSEVLVFPNPVRPEYDGPIAINGLARDADVKITDAQGQLIYETKALGGQAMWDGKDYNGRRAASGVYLVFSTSPANLDKLDAIVAKILLIH